MNRMHPPEMSERAADVNSASPLSDRELEEISGGADTRPEPLYQPGDPVQFKPENKDARIEAVAGYLPPGRWFYHLEFGRYYGTEWFPETSSSIYHRSVPQTALEPGRIYPKLIKLPGE